MTLFGIEVPEMVMKALFLVVVIIGGIIVSRILTKALRGVLERSEVPSASIFVNITKALIWFIAVLIVLKPVFGVEPTGFIAALGVTSVALSLGLQETISNLFGGLILMIGKVIVPGDVITVGSITGTVTDINLRTTTVELFSRDQQIIPNSVLAGTSLTKLAPFQAGEYRLPLMLAKDADPLAVEAELTDIVREALGEFYDDAFDTPLFILEYNNFGIVCELSIHAKAGISPSRARTAVGKAIAGKPWLA